MIDKFDDLEYIAELPLENALRSCDSVNAYKSLHKTKKLIKN